MQLSFCFDSVRQSRGSSFSEDVARESLQRVGILKLVHWQLHTKKNTHSFPTNLDLGVIFLLFLINHKVIPEDQRKKSVCACVAIFLGEHNNLRRREK